MTTLSKKLLFSLGFMFVMLLGAVLAPKIARAFTYPSGCSACTGAGSYCVEAGAGYQCGSSSLCGARLFDTSACPSGCTCGAYAYIGGNTACANNCIKVESCGGVAPPPPPPPSGGCTSPEYCVPSYWWSGQNATNCGQIGKNGSFGSCSGGFCCSDPAPVNTPTPPPSCLGSYGCQQTCNSPCANDFDCRQDLRDQWGVRCINNRCVNPICPTSTQTGAVCGCTGLATCGNPCAGPCEAGASCTYTATSGGACPFGQNLNPYCVGVSSGNQTYNPLYTRPNCVSGDTGGNYLRGPGGKTSGFTVAEIQSTCNSVPTEAWWQIQDGDAVSKGDLISKIPTTCTPTTTCTPIFSLTGQGGFPGVPIYGGANYDFSADDASQGSSAQLTNWLANSGVASGVDTYSYAGIAKQIPPSVILNPIGGYITNATLQSGAASFGNYYWYKVTGDATINENIVVTGSRRVILLVEGGDLTINGTIDIQQLGSGFFMALAGKDSNGNKGNILIGPTISSLSTDLEGMFFADSQFRTGTGGGQADPQLRVSGAVAAMGGVLLQRDLGPGVNYNTPAEVFEYTPQITLLFPRELLRDRVTWEEVAP